MKILVCVKQTADGELNPFDACAYEAALEIPDGEVTLLSMGPDRTREMLLELTRLGAREAYHLCDSAFAGADTLATAYALSLAVKRLAPDLVLCGRQTVDGDTAQTGPALSVLAGLSLITNVMEIRQTKERLVCETRELGEQTAGYPALITVERINRLRLPSIRSRKGTVVRWSAADLGADRSRCGLAGSPTRVLSTFQNQEGRRRCRRIKPEELGSVLVGALEKEKGRVSPARGTEALLKNVWIVGEGPRPFAEGVSETVTVIRREDFMGEGDDSRTFAQRFARYVEEQKPEVVLWGSDAFSKAAAPQVAALLGTGLCADCTALEVGLQRDHTALEVDPYGGSNAPEAGLYGAGAAPEAGSQRNRAGQPQEGERLILYRPAFSGNVMARIICRTNPQMATVRTAAEGGANIVCALGRGAQSVTDRVRRLVERKNTWDIAASRMAVDLDMLPYDCQVGLTGKTVNPAVYLAIGISGAVHHLAGMKQSGTVIAVNPDPEAPIFDYADYGIVGTAEEVLPELERF